LIPLLLGIFIYAYGKLGIPRLIIWYLPDGLWAYSLTSTLIIIWNGNLKTIWQFVLLLNFILFELLQYFKIIPGYGDIWDVVTYITFCVVSIKINNNNN